MCFFCRLAKQHKFQSFAVKNAVSFQKCRFDVFTEVAKLAVGKSRRLVGESRRLVAKSPRFKTLTYHRKHANAKSASVQNSWRLLEKAVLIEKAEKMHTYEDPGIVRFVGLTPLALTPNGTRNGAQTGLTTTLVPHDILRPTSARRHRSSGGCAPGRHSPPVPHTGHAVSHACPRVTRKVMNAMNAWKDEARVQHFACLALSNFAHDDASKVAIGVSDRRGLFTSLYTSIRTSSGSV